VKLGVIRPKTITVAAAGWELGKHLQVLPKQAVCW